MPDYDGPDRRSNDIDIAILKREVEVLRTDVNSAQKEARDAKEIIKRAGWMGAGVISVGIFGAWVLSQLLKLKGVSS